MAHYITHKFFLSFLFFFPTGKSKAWISDCINNSPNSVTIIHSIVVNEEIYSVFFSAGISFAFSSPKIGVYKNYPVSSLFGDAIYLCISTSSPKKRSLDEMLSWVSMFISVIIIIQSLSLWDISIGNQQNPTLAIDIKSHTFQVLLLSPFPVTK